MCLFNISWYELDSLFGPVALILQVMHSEPKISWLLSVLWLFQLVVIPALKPTLDPSLVQDKSLCSVRVLRYYLDKTKDLRKGKKLLFVAIKKATENI